MCASDGSSWMDASETFTTVSNGLHIFCSKVGYQIFSPFAGSWLGRIVNKPLCNKNHLPFANRCFLGRHSFVEDPGLDLTITQSVDWNKIANLQLGLHIGQNPAKEGGHQDMAFTPGAPLLYLPHSLKRVLVTVDRRNWSTHKLFLFHPEIWNTLNYLLALGSGILKLPLIVESQVPWNVYAIFPRAILHKPWSNTVRLFIFLVIEIVILNVKKFQLCERDLLIFSFVRLPII